MSDAREQHEPDFIDKGLEYLDHVLDVVHDKVLRPMLLAGRFIAYGFIILLTSLVLAIALLIGVLRLLNVYVFVGHVWISYLTLGAVFVALGLTIWRRRRPVATRKP